MSVSKDFKRIFSRQLQVLHVFGDLLKETDAQRSFMTDSIFKREFFFDKLFDWPIKMSTYMMYQVFDCLKIWYWLEHFFTIILIKLRAKECLGHDAYQVYYGSWKEIRKREQREKGDLGFVYFVEIRRDSIKVSLSHRRIST